MKRFVRCILLCIRSALAVLLAIVLLSVVVHQSLTAMERRHCPPVGTLVSVDGKQMNLYVTGKGAHTIVLMPGLGTVSPVLDFMPLAERLAEHNRVVIVEPFGYGWSDGTDKERTVANIVEELRAALTAGGISGPYVLMPHSVSGLDAIYYANRYPDEVAAVVGIDCTLPAMPDYFDEALPGRVSPAAGLLCQCGAMRWLVLAAPGNFISRNPAGLYSADNLAMQRQIAAWNADNTTVINQSNCIRCNLTATRGMRFSESLPLLFFTQNDAGRPARADGKNSVSFYKTYASNLACQQVTPLNGEHYLHWACAEQMATQTDAFLQAHLG